MHVLMKTWEEMEKEFGLNVEGNIPCERTFTVDMIHLCGRVIELYRDAGLDVHWRPHTKQMYYISSDMIKQVVTPEEDPEWFI